MSVEELIKELQMLVERGSISLSAQVVHENLDGERVGLVIDYSYPSRNEIYLDEE